MAQPKTRDPRMDKKDQADKRPGWTRDPDGDKGPKQTRDPDGHAAIAAFFLRSYGLTGVMPDSALPSCRQPIPPTSSPVPALSSIP